jgi:hypothetical protein
MFRATIYPSSGEITVFIRHINTVVSPDDGHIVGRNM